MGDFENGFICRCFTLKAIQKPENYPRGYGETRNTAGQLFYRTEGRLIPWDDFQHSLLFKTSGEVNLNSIP